MTVRPDCLAIELGSDYIRWGAEFADRVFVNSGKTVRLHCTANFGMGAPIVRNLQSIAFLIRDEREWVISRRKVERRKRSGIENKYETRCGIRAIIVIHHLGHEKQ